MPKKKQKQAPIRTLDSLRKKEVIIPLYFGYGLKISLVKIKRYFFSKKWHYAAALFVLFTFVGGQFLMNFFGARAATYTFEQASWAGGQSASTATHPGDQTDWTNYSTKDANLTADTSLEITTTSGSTIQTNDDDFTAGTTSNTSVKYSGDDAFVKLEETATDYTYNEVTVDAISQYNDLYPVDFDGDGDQDIVVGGTTSYRTVWMENDGSGNFTQHQVDSSFGGYYVFAIDVDSNGHMDIVSWGSPNICLSLNNGNGTFTRDCFDSGTTLANNLTAGDMEGDGDIDIVVVGYYGTFWYENDGSENFSKHDIEYDGGNKSYRGAVLKDIDGDGDNDVATCWGEIVWYENDGNEIFTYHNIYDFAYQTYALDVEDLDSDGDQDFIFGNGNNYRMTWLENDGSENFSAHTDIYGTNFHETKAVDVADFDGDRDYDILAASDNANDIAWFENDGSEIFTAHIVNESMSYVISEYASDMDNDGDQDIVWLSGSPDVVAWYEVTQTHQTSGTFTSSVIDSGQESATWSLTWDTTVPVGTQIELRAKTGATDTISGTGSCDVAVTITSANQTGTEDITSNGCVTAGHRYIQYFATLSTTDDSISPKINSLTVGYEYYPIDNTTTETNNAQFGAGALSNTVINGNGSDAQIDLSSAGLNFTQHEIAGSVGYQGAVHAKDIDDDGDVDIAYGASNGDAVYWLEQTSPETFTNRTIDSSIDGPYGIYIADVDGDGDQDVAVAAYYDGIGWYENNGSESFTEHMIASSGSSYYDMMVIDLDEDGDMDIVGAGADFYWLENDGSQNFTLQSIGSVGGAGSVYVIDVDEDGDLDYVGTASSTNSGLLWYENDGSENFTRYQVDFEGGSASHADDVDGDGDIDIIGSGFSSDWLRWYENDGNENFSAHNIDTGMAGMSDVYSEDMDGDGDIDVIATAQSPDDVRWYENDGSGNFSQHTIDADFTEANVVFATDINGDNNIDVVAGGTYGTTKVTWYESEPIYASSGTFTSQTIDTTDQGGSTIDWGNLSWNTTMPANTQVVLRVKTSDSDTITGTDVCDPVITITSANSSSSASLTGNACIDSSYRYIQYHATLSTTDTAVTPSIEDTTIAYSYNPMLGTLTSNAYDAGDATNVVASISWEETNPASADVKFQIRTASSEGGLTSAEWLGPTGTGDYYTDPNGGETINSIQMDGTDDQWLQYKVFLETSASGAAPSVDSVTLTYVVNAPPEIQNVTASQGADGSVAISYETRDSDTSDGATQYEVTPSFEYWDGDSWETCTTLGPTDTDNKTVEESNYTAHSATWYPTSDFDDQYLASTVKIRVTIDDNEAANNTASSESATFELDTTTPVVSSASVDASSDPADLSFSVSDDTDLQMMVSLDSGFSGASWEAYSTSDTIALADDPDTVYVKFKDEYGNTTSTQTMVTPETPTAMMIQDTSNLNTTPDEYRLFIAWKVVDEPTPGFTRYNVYQSDDGSSYSLLDTITNRATNYYGDSSIDFDTESYYKITTQDDDGNVSYYSEVVYGKANGVQDAGEGGGGSEDTPTISNVDSSGVSTTQATITWDTDDASDSRVEYQTATGGDFTDADFQGVASMKNTAAGLGVHSVTLTGLTPDTTYYHQVKSTNASDNSDTDKDGTDGYTFTTLDGPTISNVDDSVTDTTATITWDTDEDADSKVYYSTSASLTNPIEIGSASETQSHSVTISGLTAETIYYYYVKSDVATDNNGGNYYSFTTSEEETGGDTEGPTISSVLVSDITYNSGTITWSTDEAASSLVDYGATNSYGKTHGNWSTTTTSHSVILPSLSSLTKYYFRARSVDADDNVTIDDNSGASYSFTTLSGAVDSDDDGDGEQLEDITNEIEEMIDSMEFTEEDIQDALANVVTVSISSSGPSSSIENNTSAVISWKTNRKTTGKVVYWQDGDGEDTAQAVAENLAADTDHEVTIKNLNAQTTYRYYVVSTTPLGSTVDSDEKTFTTGDTPQISSISIADVTLNSAVISWVANSISSTVLEYGTSSSYGSEKTSSSSSSSSEHTVRLDELESGREYHIRITGTDSDDETVNSGDFSFTTLAIPEISSVQVSDILTDKATVNWDTNVNTDSMVELSVRGESKGTTQGKIESVTDHEVVLENLIPGTDYQIKVSVKDQFGNSATSDYYYFTSEDDSAPPSLSLVRSETTVFPGKEARIQTVVSWVTNKTANSAIAYREGSDGGDIDWESIFKDETIEQQNGWVIKRNTGLTNTHLFVLTDFNSSTIYRFKVGSVDKYGNTAVSDNYSLLTPAKNQSIFDLIVKNFEDTFGWVKKVGS